MSPGRGGAFLHRAAIAPDERVELEGGRVRSRRVAAGVYVLLVIPARLPN